MLKSFIRIRTKFNTDILLNVDNIAYIAKGSGELDDTIIFMKSGGDIQLPSESFDELNSLLIISSKHLGQIGYSPFHA